MKHLLDEAELANLKIESELVGYKRCENLLMMVLNGERKLFVAGETNRLTGNQEKISIYNDPNNVWCKLIERLDAQGMGL